MNYKQMVLFEELADSLTQGTMRVAFGIGTDMCLGEFRKQGSEEHVVDSEKLMADYNQYAAEDAAYFKEFEEKLKGNGVKYVDEKLLMIVFNHVYAFLAEIAYEVDDYLTTMGLV